MVRWIEFSRLGVVLVLQLVLATEIHAQTTPAPATQRLSENPVLQRIWRLGMDSSHLYPLAQRLIDSLGPILARTPHQLAAMDWMTAQYRSRGIPARIIPYNLRHPNEPAPETRRQADTALGWMRGYTHVDLVAPRVRTLEATLFALSPGTGGRDIVGDVIIPPTTRQALPAWRRHAKGKYILWRPAPLTCRPEADWKEWTLEGAQPGPPASMRRDRPLWLSLEDLEKAEVAGILVNTWGHMWGVEIIDRPTGKPGPSLPSSVPMIQVSCEDYGLLYRLAENGQGPKLRLNANAELRPGSSDGDILAEIAGTKKADEYIVLAGQFDSWDGASGAVDNGVGTATIVETMRILREAYPRPRRSILALHWNNHEIPLGTTKEPLPSFYHRFSGVRARFETDGAGYFQHVGAVSGPRGAQPMTTGQHALLRRWLGQMPDSLVRGLQIMATPVQPWTPDSNDRTTTAEAGPIHLFLYGKRASLHPYLEHTNRDTFDKLSIADMQWNATILAMLAYLASEDPAPLPPE